MTEIQYIMQVQQYSAIMTMVIQAVLLTITVALLVKLISSRE